MSVWRRKAIEAFPGQRRELEDPECTIYNVFFELLPRCVEAHTVGNTLELKKIYEFAEWCYSQKSHDLWNAVGVAFYEHLGDAEITLREMPKWVKPHIFADIAGLLSARMKPERFERLSQEFRFSHSGHRSRFGS